MRYLPYIVHNILFLYIYNFILTDYLFIKFMQLYIFFLYCFKDNAIISSIILWKKFKALFFKTKQINVILNVNILIFYILSFNVHFFCF